MKIELFTLCDGAYNYNGKLTIVGTKEGFFVHSFPEKVSFNIAMKFLITPGQVVEKKLRLQFNDPENKLMPARLECNISAPFSKEESHISLAASIQGVPLEKDGVYKVAVLLDEEVLNEYNFFVKKRNA